MAIRTPKDPEARRAYRQELRNVARLLRWAGMVLVALGTIGIALAGRQAWFVVPSWFSFLTGWALVLSGVVRRDRIPPV